MYQLKCHHMLSALNSRKIYLQIQPEHRLRVYSNIAAFAMSPLRVATIRLTRIDR